jgi:hypothetical protein
MHPQDFSEDTYAEKREFKRKLDRMRKRRYIPEDELHLQYENDPAMLPNHIFAKAYPNGLLRTVSAFEAALSAAGGMRSTHASNRRFPAAMRPSMNMNMMMGGMQPGMNMMGANMMHNPHMFQMGMHPMMNMGMNMMNPMNVGDLRLEFPGRRGAARGALQGGSSSEAPAIEGGPPADADHHEPGSGAGAVVPSKSTPSFQTLGSPAKPLMSFAEQQAIMEKAKQQRAQAAAAAAAAAAAGGDMADATPAGDGAKAVTTAGRGRGRGRGTGGRGRGTGGRGCGDKLGRGRGDGVMKRPAAGKREPPPPHIREKMISKNSSVAERRHLHHTYGCSKCVWKPGCTASCWKGRNMKS